MNERKTEIIVRKLLAKLNYEADDIYVEEQSSNNPKINKLLKSASKKGAGAGYPEFIITSSRYPDLLIVIECKADAKKHKSKDLDKYADYACDGALLYASYLAKEYDVIAIGVSGEKLSELKISSFIHLKNSNLAIKFDVKGILSLDDFYNAYIQTPEKFNADYISLLSYTQELNGKLHKLKIKESHRSLLISGMLIALKNTAFSAGYKKHKKAKQLAENLVHTVVHELDDSDIPKNNIPNLKQAYSFIKTHRILSGNKDSLVGLIEEIDAEINGFMKTHKYLDTLGQFYIEFLRYANNDKGLGIVLTPPHITELFSEIAEVNKNSVVVDSCCGTGGFLISAMKKMIADTGGDSEKISELKMSQLIGIENQDDIYALAISNMILQDDGKSSIMLSDCFSEVETVKEKSPNVGLLNPPYKTEKDDVEELEYVLNNLSMLKPQAKCVAIIPISCVLADSGQNLLLKEKLMEEHTLEAVMSMPEDLFHNSDVGVITCTLVIKAHTPHKKGKKTWLGYWRDDGFVKVKSKGRIDKNDSWPELRTKWVESYLNKDVVDQYSTMRCLKPQDEWCAEAYLDTDYNSVAENDLVDEIKKYLAFEIMH